MHYSPTGHGQWKNPRKSHKKRANMYRHLPRCSQNTTWGPWYFRLVDFLSHLLCLPTEQLLMDSKTSWGNYWRKIFSHMVLYFPFDLYDDPNFSTFGQTSLLFVVLHPNKLQKLFLIHFYRRIIFIWIWKLQIKTRSGLISFWKARCCSNIPNHLPSSSPYFSYYNDLLSLTVKDFIFVSWGS